MASLKKAVENMCKQCTYDELDTGSWRQQVERCEIKDCALFDVRPVSISTRDANRKPKVKKIKVVEL